MKGLKEYIRKHGKHFTEELAYMAGGGKWKAAQIKRIAQGKVYYNVTGSTLGDLVFLVNMHRHQPFVKCKRIDICINHALCIIGDFCFYGGKVFDLWLESLPKYQEDFDFTPYI